MAARNGSLPDGDKAYLAQLVAARTGLPQDAAEKRINEVLGQAQAAEAKARELADQARRTAARSAFFLFFSMLIGAFIASAAAALGRAIAYGILRPSDAVGGSVFGTVIEFGPPQRLRSTQTRP